MSNNRVIVLVVTFNRLSCLKECLESIKNQTYTGFDLLIVNNGSTDGTKEFLDSLENIFVIHQENLGGAGGFYTGMKYMYENGYEWLWMMDDDGVPEEHQLENLLSYKGNELYRNALVLNKENHSEFAFQNRKDPDIVSVMNCGKIIDFVHPFNGTLFHRDMINKIGFIKREMFIWGDEMEYTFRAKKFGYIPVTIASAIHYHPKEKGCKVNVFPFVSRVKIVDKPRRFSHHYYRNRGYIDKQYESFFHSVKFVMYYSFYFLRKMEFSELRKFIKYYLDGRRNNY